jgi:uncharacterized protein
MTTDTVTRLYGALGSGDAGALATALAPDVALHVPGRHHLAGTHRGPAAVLEFLTATSTATDGGERVEVLDVMGGREHVAVYARSRARRGDAVLDNPTVHLLRVEGDRVTEVWFHNRDQRSVDAFWGIR